MIDLSNQQLSDAMYLLAQEINRGCWLPDRNGIPTEMVTEVKVSAIVTCLPGEFIVQSMTVSNSGVGSQTATEEGSQSQGGSTSSAQNGTNTDTQTNTYKEV
jgi:hypothetical protein